MQTSVLQPAPVATSNSRDSPVIPSADHCPWSTRYHTPGFGALTSM
jgi:hypothetical protein